jgi:hypothetical protein
MLKVFVAPDRLLEGYVAFFIEAFANGLAKTGWTIVKASSLFKTGDAEADLKGVLGGKLPDILVMFSIKAKELGRWKASLKRLRLHSKVAVFYMAEDVHYPHDKQALSAVSPLAVAILARYPEATDHYMRHLKKKAPIYGSPHATTSLFFVRRRPWTFRKSQALLSGAVYQEFYPLRNAALVLYEDGYSKIVRRVHPGYDKLVSSKIQTKNYAKDISHYKIAISDGGFVPNNPHPYILAKHFEIPATGTVLLTNTAMVPYLKPLGFREKVNYLVATPETLEETLDYWLDPKQNKMLERIAFAGYHLVKKLHTMECRVKTFNRLINRLYKKERK